MKFIIFLLSILLIFSCSKNKVEIPPLPVNDSIYITRIKQINKSTFDTSYFEFRYDSLKRVTEMYKIKYNTYTHMLDSTLKTYYQYTGSFSQPARTVMINPVAIGHTYTRTDIFTYDAQKRLIRDSSIHEHSQTGMPISRITNTYTYTANGFIDSSFVAGTNGSLHEIISQVKDQQGDIVREERTEPTTTLDITYDSRPNPLYNLSTVQVPYLENKIFASFLEYFITPQRKNVLRTVRNHFNQWGGFSYSEITNYQIIYRADGYPLEINAVSTPFYYSNTYKYLFVYSAL